jgi:hypothetical protein
VKKVLPQLDFIGWYAICDGELAHSVTLHEQVIEFFYFAFKAWANNPSFYILSL